MTSQQLRNQCFTLMLKKDTVQSYVPNVMSVKPYKKLKYYIK